MKLDENVCRGSLILHNGASYVVVGSGPVTTRVGYNPAAIWWIMPTEWFEKDSVRIDSRMRVWVDEEVEMFFPGDVFPLPDYIK